MSGPVAGGTARQARGTPSGGFGGPGGRRRGGMGFGPPGHGAMLPAEKPKNFGATFRRLVGELRPERPRILLVIAVAFASTAGTILGPKILGSGIDKLMNGLIGKMLGQIFPAGTTHDQAVQALRAMHNPMADLVAASNATPGVGVDFGALGAVLLTLAGLYLLASAFAFVAWYTMAGVAQRTVYRLRRDVDLKLARLPLKYFDTHQRGDTLSRVTNDIDNIANTLQQSLTQIITSLVTIIGVLAMMFWISPMLAAISLLVLPVAAVSTMLIARQSQKQFAAQWKQTGDLSGHVEENHTGHPIVKVFGHQEDAIRRFDELNEGVYEASFRAQFISGIVMPTMNFVGNLNYVAIAVLGGIQVATGSMSLGDVQAFIQYSRQFTQPITQVASIMNVLQSTIASAERVFELLDEPEEIPDVEQPQVLEHTLGHVTLAEIGFRYEPDKPLIDDLNADVRSGEVLAIVGPTGAGKTTLVNLLMRFYEIDAGVISVDGIDTRRLTRDNLRRSFGMVLQDTWLFGGTIRENIAYGRENATEDEIVAAAKAAHVDHFVRTMPHGYDTVIDDDASNLSSGEKQLLTIARAFLADPEILILDEATSSVDTRTEVLVQQAMARLMKGRTAFVIAHRLSTIRNADEILVMDHGKIVEQGSHDELIARRGFYYDLYNSQFEEAIAEAV
ncbi:MAG: ABC transporter ATP-binding protein [Candidatus Limnocylindrales bacterium]|jgi:ATP-binding cassette subfamily B protein